MRLNCILVMGLLMLLFCLPTMRLNRIEAKAPNSCPVHNLNTGLNYTTFQEAIDAPAHAQAPLTWIIQTVDSTGDVGKYSSIALDLNNSPHISYYDATNFEIKYAYWNGSSWTIQTVDSTGDLGDYSSTSLALDFNDNPHISYCNNASDMLRYAYWNGSSWSVQSVDPAGWVGGDSSLALDSGNNPHISYYNWQNNKLRYAYWNGSSWTIQTVDSGGSGSSTFGMDTSLALDFNDNPHISYYDGVNYEMKYAYWNGSSWTIRSVDSVVGKRSSLALDSSSNPHISYYDDKNGNLKYAVLEEHARQPGLDVSHYQGNINWTQVHDASYRFAFAKASEGIGWTDPNFATNMENGRNAGLLMGTYHFARPDLGNDPADEARYFVSITLEYLSEGRLRPVLDLEVGSWLGKDALSNWVHTWMGTVRNETSIEPIIYVNSNYANNYLDASVSKYDLWIAHWTYDPTASPDTGIWDTWDFWQYSNNGSILGITGDVDLDIFNGNMQRLCDAFTISNVRVFNVVWENKTYPITIFSNSTVAHLVFTQPPAQISFNITGSHGSEGYCNVTIPKDLLKGPWTYTTDGETPSIIDISEGENATHNFIYFTYIHASTFRITIQGEWVVPEFPSTIILPLFMLATLLVVVIYRKKRISIRQRTVPDWLINCERLCDMWKSLLR